MDIGELNRRVEILKYFVKRDAYGGEDGRWLPVGRVLGENRTSERNGVFHGAASLGRDGYEDNNTVLCGLGRHAPNSLRRQTV